MSEIDRVYKAQRENQATVAATTCAERAGKFHRLERTLLARRPEIRAAMWEDFRKPPEEVDLTEVFAAVSEARHARRHLKKWMRPERAAPSITLIGSRSRLMYEPKGVVLIISPWNFPFNLTLGPLVSAVAAGNCAMLKPSELTPASSACMKRILGDLFPENEVAVIEGDAAVSTEILRRRFDHIFFTGSANVGKIVMKAAAEHLTPVTLELGGKSPAIVDKSANLDLAASRIAWGKYLNSGQVCIAPDYVLVDEEVREVFTGKLKKALAGFGPHPGLVVNDRHAARVKRLFDTAGATTQSGGEFEGRSMPATILTNVTPGAEIMKEEIFGPLLPIIPYGNLEEAMRLVSSREKPLVLYLFSQDRDVIDSVLARTSAGGTVINHTLIHFYQLNLPFGGAGNSGMGRGHGQAGFQTFSNAKGILEQRTTFSMIDLLFPPYTRLKRKLIDITLRYL